ncbi:hypothetical protein HAX54_009287, partial [Datura stramonium]|nr:hypothetical protein [Datura stramonium]
MTTKKIVEAFLERLLHLPFVVETGATFAIPNLQKKRVYETRQGEWRAFWDCKEIYNSSGTRIP